MRSLAKTFPFCPGLGFLVIFLSFLQYSYSQRNPYQLEKTCGVLYSQDNFSGDEFQLKDGDQSVNLFDEHRVSSGWNITGSIDITSGCKLQMCNESYFDGVCQTVEQGSYRINKSLEVQGGVASVRCLCKKECQCSDIFMKKSSCARGYLKGGCSTCNSLYTDLFDAETKFPGEFYGKVEALRLRKGCMLTLYPDEDYGGDEEIISQEIFENFNGTFRSYECQCDDDEYVPRVRPPRPAATFPPMINVPTTVDSIINMLTNTTFTGHPGLLSALMSAKSGRSSKNAYILLLGTTGSGKSSAINLLFDNPNITKVGDVISTTTNIHEFRIPIPVDELGIGNSELRIIDTPGLGDTRGLEQDAKFLATLENFLSNHEELKDTIPNVVLIFHKFNDNRFGGIGSNFVKMLRGLDSFRDRITDKSFSNVIFVLSHFCSENKATVRNPAIKLNQFKKAIEDFTLFPRPTILNVAENLGKFQDLPMVNGYFQLPNNEYYPRNLFEKLELVTKNGGDLVGQGVFRTAFRDSEGLNITSSTFPLVGRNSGNVEKYLRVLSNAFFSVNNTEVSQLLQQAWDSNLTTSLKSQFPDSLPYLQRSLNIRNINTREDIPKTNRGVVKLLTGLKHDQATKILLETGLDIKAPVFHNNLVAGHGYNVFKDISLPTSPFQLTTLQQSDMGYMIPKVFTCKLEQETGQNFVVFDSKEKYIQARLRSLGIEGNVAEGFRGNIKPGYNMRINSFTNDSCTLSAVREYRLFELVLNDKLLDFSSEFVNMVKALPVFNSSDFQTVDTWNDFFSYYGTHVVRSVHGGGSIQIHVESDQPCNENIGKVLFDLVKFAEDMSFMIVAGNCSQASDTNRTVLMNGIQNTLIFHGGDIEYHVRDLTTLSVQDASKLFAKWKKSLKFNPTILSSEMKLIPISQVVKKVGRNYSSEIERATSLLFNSSLKYEPSKKNSDNYKPSRDETPLMAEVLSNLRKTKEQMEEMLRRIKQLEMENAKPSGRSNQSNVENQSSESTISNLLNNDPVLTGDSLNQTIVARNETEQKQFDRQMNEMARQREEQKRKAEEQSRRLLERYQQQTKNHGVYAKHVIEQMKQQTENQQSEMNSYIEMIRRKNEEKERQHEALMKRLRIERCKKLRDDYDECKKSSFKNIFSSCTESDALKRCNGTHIVNPN